MGPVRVILATVRPSPVLHVWRDGIEVAAVALTSGAAVALASAILAALPPVLTADKPARP
jgi:hypothetical protein